MNDVCRTGIAVDGGTNQGSVAAECAVDNRQRPTCRIVDRPPTTQAAPGHSSDIVIEGTRLYRRTSGIHQETGATTSVAILERDATALGRAMSDCREAQRVMFPRMVPNFVQAAIDSLPTSVLGTKLSGAGGGGYLFVVAETPPPGFERLVLRHPD